MYPTSEAGLNLDQKICKEVPMKAMIASVRNYGWLILSMMIIFSLQVFAQSSAVAPPTFLDGILKFIAGLNPAVTAGVLAVVEVLLRLAPSQKAQSLLVPVKYVLDGVAAIFAWASGVIGQLITSLNNVTPSP